MWPAEDRESGSGGRSRGRGVPGEGVGRQSRTPAVTESHHKRRPAFGEKRERAARPERHSCSRLSNKARDLNPANRLILTNTNKYLSEVLLIVNA